MGRSRAAGLLFLGEVGRSKMSQSLSSFPYVDISIEFSGAAICDTNLVAMLHILFNQQLSVLRASVNPPHGADSKAYRTAIFIRVETRHCKMSTRSIAKSHAITRDVNWACGEYRHCEASWCRGSRTDRRRWQIAVVGWYRLILRHHTFIVGVASYGAAMVVTVEIGSGRHTKNLDSLGVFPTP
jgi:hypothetical protein